MTRSRCAALAVWATAWLAGRAASDDVLRVTIGDDGPHRVIGLPDGPGGPPPPPAPDGLAGPSGPNRPPSAPLAAALIEWRRCADAVRLVLPVPGDPRGLPGPPEFRAAALDAGEAVYGGWLGLVPQVFDHPVSSAPATVTWTAFVVEQPPQDPLSIADAQFEL
ncbi:MAG: hypothetical protein FWD74_12235, partial [Actinomycetia bacterium]|nr:hypothetical protein [Actinomycetes bacterium]